MQVSKRSFSFVGVFAIGLAALTGCGGGSKEDSAEGKQERGDQASIGSSEYGDSGQDKSSDESQQQPQDIVATAAGAGSFETLLAAAKAGGLVETLQGEGPLTVFAPTDEAFAKLPAGTFESLLKPENKDQLVAILTYHVVPGKVMSGEAMKLNAADTVNGQSLSLASSDSGLTVDGAHVVKADIVCSNGVIHVIDSVILPGAAEGSASTDQPEPATKDIVSTAVGAGSFNTLVAAVKAAGLVETLQGDGPFTVFAPSDEAFAKLPAGTVENLLKPENKDQLIAVLTYHVVPGKVMSAEAVKLTSASTVNGQPLALSASDAGLSVDNAKVVAADIDCSNGVIHVIDSVILPKVKEATAAAEATEEVEDIVATAIGAGSFKTLVAAVQAAELVDVLQQKGPYTVFAPTDEAFAKLPTGTVEELLKPENREKLQAVLTYHVVPGKVMAAEVLKLADASTVNGQSVRISVSDDDSVKVNEATVLKTDIQCSNGVIHVIDSVLLPE
jgi:transforming growth factor-beta-induced protein